MTSDIRAKMDEVDRLRKTGLTSREACNQVGWTAAAYYWHKRPKAAHQRNNERKKYKKRVKNKPALLEIPVQHMEAPSAKVFVLYGDPLAVANAVRSLQ